MKKYISHLVFALLGCAALSACVDDDYMELDKGQNELVLTASKTEVVLNEQAHADDALELSWTTGTNYGTGNKISYTLELTKTGSDFADSYVAVENAVQEYSWKKSVEELNDILRNHFGATAGENISLEARLTATVTERDEKQVSTTAFSVTAYEPLTSTLYLIGSATPGGWSADNATEMTRKDNGIFTWTGGLWPVNLSSSPPWVHSCPLTTKEQTACWFFVAVTTSRMNLLLSKKTIITSSRPICLPVFLH